MMFAYVQPVSQHLSHPERLLVWSADGRWYLWFGDRDGTPLEEIEPPVAHWLQHQPNLALLPEPHFWLHVDDLPLAPEAARRRGGEGLSRS